MHFDERQLRSQHINKAIERYMADRPKHPPARSAFLIFKNEKLPAKHILKMAFEELYGIIPNSEQITGGRASVRVLDSLGFDTIYEKPLGTSNRNIIKNARREAFKQVISNKWGKVESEYKFDGIIVPDLENRQGITTELLNILSSIEAQRQINVKGKKNYKLSCDFFLPDVNLVIEFDERQHFTLLRAASLAAYPNDVKLGFDAQRWMDLSFQIQAGDNSPIYRDEQRAFYDSLRDILAIHIGLKPVVRIFEEDVLWERGNYSLNEASIILDNIQMVIDS